jgi:mono/diheme cytochrome c family protein
MSARRRRLLSGREAGILAAILLALFAVMQLLPLGAQRTNPPVVAEPEWDSQRTRELFLRVCGDCHSNETRWPWYAHLAPVSWLLAYDVTHGREQFNVSEWHRPQEGAHEAAKEYREGNMPLPLYLATHPEARLDAAARAELLAGLEATFGEKERAGG